MREFLTAEGYPLEDHYVTTADGYILHLHRIPAQKPGRPARVTRSQKMHQLDVSRVSVVRTPQGLGNMFLLLLQAPLWSSCNTASLQAPGRIFPATICDPTPSSDAVNLSPGVGW